MFAMPTLTAEEDTMENERFNLSLRRFLKQVGISSQQEIERVVREEALEGSGKLHVKMVLTAEGTGLRHEVEGEIDLG
jgi:hypothetical protein